MSLAVMFHSRQKEAAPPDMAQHGGSVFTCVYGMCLWQHAHTNKAARRVCEWITASSQCVQGNRGGGTVAGEPRRRHGAVMRFTARVHTHTQTG